MKKKFLLITALFVAMCMSIAGLVACVNNEEPVDPDKQSIEITNPMDLGAKWNVGEPDRTVEVKLSDGLKNKQVTLTAEPEGVVTIDGLKLTAAKQGTAVVTAKVSLDAEHEYTDSVEVSVKYNYALTIANKAALTKAFRLEEEDRELTITLPDAIKNNPVTVTSSDNNIVSVNGKTIRAANEGEATITAKTSLDGVEFKDSFKVKVWGAFDLTLTNLDDFTDPISKQADPIEVKYTMTNEGDYTAADVIITPEDDTVVTVENGKIKPVGVGTTKVTVACGGVTREFNVTIEVLPVLTLAAFDTTVERYVGDSFELPAILAAADSQEQFVNIDDISVTCANDNLTINKETLTVSADQIGKYTVTYKFTDESKGEKTAAVTFDVVEKLFDGVVTYKDGAQTRGKLMSALEGEEGSCKQVVTTDKNDLFVGPFNGVTPSKFYYAEATFATDQDDIRLAMGHYDSANKYLLASTLGSRSGNLINIDVPLTQTDNIARDLAASNNQTCTYVYNVLAVKHITRLPGDTGSFIDTSACTTTLVKIAVARDGDYFYTFINDQYVQTDTLKTLRNVDTVPALVGKYFVNGNGSVSDIYYSADEATVQAKLYTAQGLLGEHKEKMFVPYIDSNSSPNKKDGSSNVASHYQAYEDNVEINTSLSSSANGTAFTFNNGINSSLDGANNQAGATVSPYIYFDGNFTYSWDLKLTASKALRSDKGAGNADNNRSILELKDNTIGYDILALGVGPESAKTTGSKFQMTVKGYSSSNNDGYRRYCNPNANEWGGTGMGAFDITTTVRFSLTRIIKEDHVEFIMTATMLDNNGSVTNKTYTRIVNIGGSETQVQAGNYATAHSRAKDPVIPYWRNSGVSGEFTNISWSLLPDEINGIEAEFVADDTNATTLTHITESLAIDRNGTETETVESDVLILDNAVYNQDLVIDLGEGHSLEAGTYTVKIAANGDRAWDRNSFDKTDNVIDPNKPRFAYYDLESSDVYTTTVEVTENSRYLKLNGITLGHGVYNIIFTPAE